MELLGQVGHDLPGAVTIEPDAGPLVEAVERPVQTATRRTDDEPDRLRFSLAGVMTSAERRQRVSDSWRLTKGRFWRLLGCYGLAVVLMLAALCVSLSKRTDPQTLIARKTNSAPAK